MGWKSQPRWHKSRRYWYCRHGGRQHYLSRDYATAVRRFAEIVGHDLPGEQPLTVAMLIAEWSRLHAKRFHGEWLAAWDRHGGQRRLIDLPPDHLVEYRNHLQRATVPRRRRRYSPVTIRSYVKLAHRVLTWGCERGWIGRVPDKPALPIPPSGERHIDGDDLKRAWATLPPRAERILRFILETGCRPSEACNLRWPEVHLEHRVCVLAQHKTASRDNVRTVPLTNAAISVLSEIGVKRRGYVFLSRRGQPYKATSLRSICKRRGFVPYQLRHTRAQSLADAGESVQDIARWLGHRSVTTAMGYVTVRDARLRQLAERAVPLSPALSPAGTPHQTGKASKSTRRKAAPAKKRKRAAARGRKAG